MENDTRSRSWILTLPNEHYDKETVEKGLKSYSYIGQLEKGVGENSYLHWQIYVENATQIKFSTLRNKFPKGHFEMRNGTKQQAYDYCTKEDTSQGVSLQNGEIDLTDNSGQRNDLLKYAEMIQIENLSVDRVIAEFPAAARYSRELDRIAHSMKQMKAERYQNLDVDREVYYLWGKTGVGKTRGVYNWLARDNETGLVKYTDVYRVTNYKNPFDQYEGQKYLVFDEFAGQIDFSELLMMCDRYPHMLKARYNDKIAQHHIVVFLSNAPLGEIYTDVQQNSPMSWDALMRRIDLYAEILDPVETLITNGGVDAMPDDVKDEFIYNEMKKPVSDDYKEFLDDFVVSVENDIAEMNFVDICDVDIDK